MHALHTHTSHAHRADTGEKHSRERSARHTQAVSKALPSRTHPHPADTLTHTRTHTHTRSPRSSTREPLLAHRPATRGHKRCRHSRAPLLQAPADRLPAPLCHARTNGHGPAAHPQLLPLPRTAFPRLQTPSDRGEGVGWGGSRRPYNPLTKAHPKGEKKTTPAPPHGHAPTLGHGSEWHNKWQRPPRPAPTIPAAKPIAQP